jgi:prephenate dehydrogenase
MVVDDDDAAVEDPASWNRVIALAEAVGAIPLSTGAQAHDRAMSYVSHAPQLIASAIYSVAARAGVLGEAGPGFRDVTRISGAPVSTWRDIFQTNRVEIAAALGEILEPLIEVRRLLSEGDEAAVGSAIALLEQAHSAKVKRQAELRPKSEPSR